MALRANVLAKGFSGIRRETLELLIELLNRGVHPVVPSRGSVGASGDLAPLAHLALVLVGEGYATVTDSPVHAGNRCTAAAGLSPITLLSKEGLALINGTQPSTAVAALALVGADRLARAADITAALSIDALRGSMRPFDPRIHDARPHAGQRASAANILALLEGSAINKSHENCGTRAGRLLAALRRAGARRRARRAAVRAPTLTTEANAATDNPMVFGDCGRNRVGRELSRRADCDRRGPACHRRDAVRDDQRAALGSARQSRAQRPRPPSSRAPADCSPAT